MKRIHIPEKKVLIYEPENGNKSNVVMFLHGRGEEGNGDSDIYKVERNGLPKHAKNGREYQYVIYAPQASEPWINGSITYDAVEDMLKLYPNSTYHITGLSNGGNGVFKAFKKYADLFKTLGCVCGCCMKVSSEFPNNPSVIKQWHGTEDRTISYNWAKNQFNELLNGTPYGKNGAEFISMKGYGHNVWDEVYKENGMYDQFISKYLSDDIPESEPIPESVIKTYDQGVEDGKVIGWNECIDAIQKMKK